MTITTLETIPRDRFNRPLVTPPNGGKPVPYTRCTTFVGALEDTYNLGKWMQRMVAKGLSMRPDLLLAVSATDLTDKKRLDKIVDDAREAAAASAAATIGSAVHSLTERVDRGEPLGVIPDAYQADLEAYSRATEPLTAVMIEQFCVLDDLRIGGTPDRVVEYNGKRWIADVKTGSIEYGLLKICMQLAVYAHSDAYNHRTGQRTPLGVEQDRALVIHLPAGTGTCELVWVDIAAGWEAVQVARQVREWRSRKGLSAPFAADVTDPMPPADLDNLIASAVSVEELTGLWERHQARWTPANTELASARKALLLGGAA